MVKHATIAGGGFIGCLTALTLTRLNIAVTLLEATEPQQSNDIRGIALNNSSIEFLKSLNLWSDLENQAEPILKVHVSAFGKFSKIHFDAKEENLSALGYVILGGTLLNKLEQEVKKSSLISIVRPASIENINPAENGYEVTYIEKNTSQAHTIQTDLLIAADGQNSSLRSLLNIKLIEKDPEQAALLTNITLSNPHQNIAFERFTPEGVIAMLPLSKNTYKLVITADPEKIKQWQVLPLANFLTKLHHFFGNFLGKFINADKISIYPLTSAYVEKQVLPHAVLLGNAAHTLLPIAAQGLNLGIHDIACFSRLLTKGQYEPQPPLIKILQDYATEIKHQQKAIIRFTSLLATIKPSCFQELSFFIFEYFPGLKHHFAQKLV